MELKKGISYLLKMLFFAAGSHEEKNKDEDKKERCHSAKRKAYILLSSSLHLFVSTKILFRLYMQISCKIAVAGESECILFQLQEQL
jgi:hypothetical protein